MAFVTRYYPFYPNAPSPAILTVDLITMSKDDSDDDSDDSDQQRLGQSARAKPKGSKNREDSEGKRQALGNIS